MPFSIFHDPFAFLFPVHQEKFGAVSDANAATAATAANAANAANAAIAANAAALKFGPSALQSNHIYHQNKGIFFHHFVKLRSNDSEISERNRFFPEMQLQGQRLFPPCEKNLDDGSFFFFFLNMGQPRPLLFIFFTVKLFTTMNCKLGIQ